MNEDTGEDIPDNPIVHKVNRIGQPTALCGADLSVVGTTYTTRADMVTCVDCIALL